MSCKTCGGTMIGDGHTTVRHCEYADVPMDVEPDAGPIYCVLSFEDRSVVQPEGAP